MSVVRQILEDENDALGFFGMGMKVKLNGWR